MGKPFHFLMLIEKGVIPPHYSQVHVEYVFKVNEFSKETFKTKSVTMFKLRSKKKQ